MHSNKFVQLMLYFLHILRLLLIDNNPLIFLKYVFQLFYYHFSFYALDMLLLEKYRHFSGIFVHYSIYFFFIVVFGASISISIFFLLILVYFFISIAYLHSFFLFSVCMWLNCSYCCCIFKYLKIIPVITSITNKKL